MFHNPCKCPCRHVCWNIGGWKSFIVLKVHNSLLLQLTLRLNPLLLNFHYHFKLTQEISKIEHDENWHTDLGLCYMLRGSGSISFARMVKVESCVINKAAALQRGSIYDEDFQLLIKSTITKNSKEIILEIYYFF